MKRALNLIFPATLIREPVICQMARKFDVVFNLRRAKINERVGEIVLELEGDDRILDQAEGWLRSLNVRVEPITHDTLES